MIKRALLATLLCVIAVMVSIDGFSSWRNDPARHHPLVEGTILSHEVRLDYKRWKEGVKEVMVVETRAGVADPNWPGPEAREVLVREYFDASDEAYQFATAHPPGGKSKFQVLPDGREGIWASGSPLGLFARIGIGIVCVVAALCVVFPATLQPQAQCGGAGLACAVFLGCGITMASSMWPESFNHVRAANWPLVKYQLLGNRTTESGKSKTEQIAIRYQFDGKHYTTVESPDAFGKGNEHNTGTASSQCRINPAKPSQAFLSWGWRLGLGLAVFPVPFIVCGLGGLLGITVPSMRRWSSKPDTNTSATPWVKVAEGAFFLVFAGSIVGLFVVLCAEMWRQGDSMKWLLTLGLVPFVFLVLRDAYGFFRVLAKAIRG